MNGQIQSKGDRDRVRQRTISNRAALDAVKSIIREFAQGRTSMSCITEIIKVLDKT